MSSSFAVYPAPETLLHVPVPSAFGALHLIWHQTTAGPRVLYVALPGEQFPPQGAPWDHTPVAVAGTCPEILELGEQLQHYLVSAGYENHGLEPLVPVRDRRPDGHCRENRLRQGRDDAEEYLPVPGAVQKGGFLIGRIQSHEKIPHNDDVVGVCEHQHDEHGETVDEAQVTH